MKNKDRDDHENEVIGRMLRWPETLAIASLNLKSTYFRTFKNGLVFDAAMVLWDAGKPVELASVAHEIHLRRKTEDAPYDYLYQLWDGAPTPANMEYYCQRVRDFHIIQSLKRTAAEIGQEAENPSGSTEDLLQDAERKILERYHCAASEHAPAAERLAEVSQRDQRRQRASQGRSARRRGGHTGSGMVARSGSGEVSSWSRLRGSSDGRLSRISRMRRSSAPADHFFFFAAFFLVAISFSFFLVFRL